MDEQTKKPKKRLTLILIIAAAVLLAAAGVLIACMAAQRTALCDYRILNMTISLPKGFEEYPVDGFEGCYCAELDERAVVVFAKKVPFDTPGFAENFEWYTTEQFMRRNTVTVGYQLQMHGDIPYVEYEHKAPHAEKWYYLVAGYKAEDAFWLVFFASEQPQREYFHDRFLNWTETVRFEQ